MNRLHETGALVYGNGMGTGFLWLIGVVGVAIFAVLLRFAVQAVQDRKCRASAVWFFWTFVPIAVACAFIVADGPPDVTEAIRNTVLGFVGAALGASIAIWAGYAYWGAAATERCHIAQPPFSGTQSIKTLPPDMDGNETLRLDSAATMSLVEYSLASATFMLDAVPFALDLKVPEDFPLKLKDSKLTVGGQKFVFDVGKNKRHEVKAGGRCFVVTLFEVKQLDVPSVANPREFVFGISEK
jgi:hypothetical protein